MKIITVNNYEDFSSVFPVSQDILPPLTEKDFNLSGLDSKIRSRLFQLLISHKSAFARSTVELSAATTEHHRISLQHDYPIKCPIYKIPFNLRNEFRRQIADLEKAGIISKSNSQYNTPALFVKQKEKWRLVLDFRKLNEITLTQDFVIPTLDDILHEISGSNYFSALDMKSAFNQIPLHFADRHKTAFSTPDGDKYQFNRLCFGLKNSPKAFQSIAQEVLGDLLHHGALVYIDDIILFTKTIDEHFELLGFVVTPEAILIDKDNSVSINEFPVPKDQKQIKFFLGCCNFYRRYIKNFAKRALPLTNLLRKDTPFEWTSETQEAFDDIKKAKLNPPVLALPDQNAELQITTDASSRGIGAVLEQKNILTLKSSTTRKQVCIPHCLKAKILESVHSEYGGHLKFFKTYHRLSENFFWHNMYKDTKNFVRSCTICLSRKNAFKISPAPHQPVEQSTEPGETCHMDIFGPLKTPLKEHGRDIQLSYTYEKNSDTPQNKYEYVEKLLPSLEHTFNKVLNNLKDQEASHVELSTRATKQHHYDYKIGSLCFIKTPNIKSNLSPKLRPKFEVLRTVTLCFSGQVFLTWSLMTDDETVVMVAVTELHETLCFTQPQESSLRLDVSVLILQEVNTRS
ncbi:retrovirus-related Pol polyprotein from transposon 17.6 [Trichonephila clavipes]|nr:retrovirus-related Pol polyprotein from transposon 17.6 [Trichonephila clavipes]